MWAAEPRQTSTCIYSSQAFRACLVQNIFWCFSPRKRRILTRSQARAKVCTYLGIGILCCQVERQAMEEAAQERHKAEVRHAYTELLHMEDWSGASRDRFLGVKPNTAFEQRLKQVSMMNGHDAA